jgi:hypothetical protein
MRACEPFPTTTASSEGGRSSWALAATSFGSFTNETYFGRTDGRAHCAGRADRASRNQRDCGLDIRQSNLGERQVVLAPGWVQFTISPIVDFEHDMVATKPALRSLRCARRDADAHRSVMMPAFVATPKPNRAPSRPGGCSKAQRCETAGAPNSREGANCASSTRYSGRGHLRPGPRGNR